MPTTHEDILKQIQDSDGNYDAIDLDSFTVNELKNSLHTLQQSQPKRDDKGRFVAEPEAAEEADAQEDDGNDEVTYRREIDLGDGAGKQVFEASSPEELIDQLVKAQENATRKIREQAQQIRETKEEKAAREKAEQEDEFVLSQELMQRPTEAVKKAFKKATGIDIADLKTVADRVKALDNAQTQQADLKAQEEASNSFVTAHPEYVANQRNGGRLIKAVNLLIFEEKQAGNNNFNYGTLLEKAYSDLRESGLLELNNSEDATAEQAPTGAAAPRIEDRAEKVEPAQRQVRKSSSLMNRARGIAAPKVKDISEDDIYNNMTLEQAKEWAAKQVGR